MILYARQHKISQISFALVVKILCLHVARHLPSYKWGRLEHVMSRCIRRRYRTYEQMLANGQVYNLGTMLIVMR